MSPYWDMIRSILGGAQAMREAGTKYLPRFQAETKQQDPSGVVFDPYELRRTTAPFTNIYEDIIRSLASKPFSQELNMKEGTPPKYTKLAENIDGQGNNLHAFARETFELGIHNAFTFIFIDFPKAKVAAGGRPLSVVEEQDLGLRPYWVQVPADRVLAIYSDFVDGIEVVTHARIYEPTIVLDGYVERLVDRVRVLNRLPVAWDEAGKPAAYGPATWEIWELVINKTTDTGSWVLVEDGVFTIGFIPLVRFATGKRLGRSYQYNPALRAVAEMQIDEFQQESNLKNIMELTCFPMLSGRGVNRPESSDPPSIGVGPRMVLYGGVTSDGQQGEWKYLEPGGASVKVVMEHLNETRTNMHDLGMQPMIESNLTVITTGQVAVKANSALQAWTFLFKDALEQAWKITALWWLDKFEPEVNIYTDFAAIIADPTQMTTLVAMRSNKDLSRNSIINAAIRFDLLPSDFDIDKNESELAEEQQGLQGEQNINPLTGLPYEPLPPPALPPGPPPPPQPAPRNGGRRPPLQ
jgi:hypothetical protein